MTKIKQQVGPYGDKRDGAGRKYNVKKTLWMQLAVTLSDKELAMVHALTPTQRRDCLISWGKGKKQALPGDTIQRKFHNTRLQLKLVRDKAYILALSETERRQRLLSAFA
jgi:hypothetical protein